MYAKNNLIGAQYDVKSDGLKLSENTKLVVAAEFVTSI